MECHPREEGWQEEARCGQKANEGDLQGVRLCPECGALRPGPPAVRRRPRQLETPGDGGPLCLGQQGPRQDLQGALPLHGPGGVQEVGSRWRLYCPVPRAQCPAQCLRLAPEDLHVYLGVTDRVGSKPQVGQRVTLLCVQARRVRRIHVNPGWDR